MPSAPNYTNAALVMGLVNLLWIFMALWAAFGFHVVLLVGFLLDRMIIRLGRSDA
ncbi:hypothetical protein [uncultured Roseovarius sp.]|uniref:hypothetical protein n=1 Tax=uncultured Roseovarius sp. TaxID=293344 RepID=UPI0026123C94|nr:hypothetical protein [uncultured Roseovarius sp.]